MDDAPVRDARPLGHAGGARCVDDERVLLGLHGTDLLIQGIALRWVGGQLSALGQRDLEGPQAGFVVVPHALGVHGQHVFEVGQAVAVAHGVQDLVGLLLVAADGEPGAAVTHDVLQLGPGVGRVDAHRHATQRLRRQVGVKPFG
ncbi:hypothetical protein FQZ97_874580 [compost metagenome]